jgi:small subunit ribosomal protein S13
MPRISGVNIPKDKKIKVALTYIYGIGLSSSKEILKSAKIDQETRAKDLTSEEINRLQKIIEKDHTVEGELKREVINSIKRLKQIDCWRGERHKKGLPVRGQRTKTNSRTVRGNVRRTVGSGRKPAPTAK